MSEEKQACFTPRRFDPFDAQHVQSIVGLYLDYLMEGFASGEGWPDGHPVGSHLETVLIECDGEFVGFASYSPDPCAVQLVYVAPDYRRRGLIRESWEAMRDSFPGPMRAAGPLSPAAQSLAMSLGISEFPRTAEGLEERARQQRELGEVMAAQCQHKHGRPGWPCKRCYQKHAERTANAIVMVHVKACSVGQKITI